MILNGPINSTLPFLFPFQNHLPKGERKASPVGSADSLFGGIHRTVDFESFSKVLNRPGGFRDPGEPEEYCRGFQVFDKDMTGFIGVGQLRYILTNLGEKMSDEEVDELLKAVDTSSGEINYTDLVRTILAN